MRMRMMLLAIPMTGMALIAGCHGDHDHDHDDWDHRRVERRHDDVIVVPARGDRWDHDDHHDGRDGWRHD